MKNLLRNIPYLIAMILLSVSCEDARDPLYSDSPMMIQIMVDETSFSNTRASNSSSYTGTDRIDYLNTLEVKVTAREGGFDWRRIAPETGTDGKPTITVFGVKYPSKIELRANGGQPSYRDINAEYSYRVYTDPSDYSEYTTSLSRVDPHHVPLYGSTGTIVETPDRISDSQGKEYIKFTAEVRMVIPISRLEISGVGFHHGIYTGPVTQYYSTATLSGLYLDMRREVLDSPLQYDMSHGTYAPFQTVTTPSGWDSSVTGSPDYVLKISPGDVLNPGDCDIRGEEFLKKITYPTDEGNSYSFNLFPHSKDPTGPKTDRLPSVKFYFTHVTRLDHADCSPVKYAIVTRYIDGKHNEITSFKPGYIYQITSINIEEENLVDDYLTERDVTAVVSVKPWDVLNTSVDITF